MISIWGSPFRVDSTAVTATDMETATATDTGIETVTASARGTCNCYCLSKCYIASATTKIHT